MLHRGSNCSPARAMNGRIMRHGIISSCQSAATSDFRDCKALLVTSSRVSSAIASTRPLPFFPFIVIDCGIARFVACDSVRVSC